MSLIYTHMYFYFRDQYRWHDRVSRETGYTFDIQAGDICEVRAIWYVLCLGEKISRSEQYPKKPSRAEEWEWIHTFPWVISDQALTLLHRFVNERYTTYKKAIPLRIPDPDRLLSLSTAQSLSKTTRTQNIKKPKKIEPPQHFFRNIDIYTDIQKYDASSDRYKQTLILFPDVWTMAQSLDITQAKTNKHILVLHNMTTPAKAKAYWKIKQWEVQYIFATTAQMFWDWYALWHIIVIKGDRNYYKTMQDPRYHAVTVAAELTHVYDAFLDTHLLSDWKLKNSDESD